MHNYKKFTKEQRSSFPYWFAHWRAFNDLARELGVWKFRHIFHDIEKPFLRLFMDYKKVQEIHRKHNPHHLEYKGEHNWLDMYIDWECSRYTKVASPRTAVEEANLKLENGTMSYNDYCEFMRVARNIEQREKTPCRHDVDMTNKEKDLLLKDLCTRLPHKQKVCYKIHDNSEEITETLSGFLLDYFKTGKISVVKAYLRPMSSMTEEEGERLEQIAKETLGDFMFEAEEDSGAIYHMNKWKTLSPAMFDYLNSIHIDYRGLIPMGLALEAPEGMYETKRIKNNKKE